MQNIFQNIPTWFYIIPVIMVLYFIGFLFYVKKSRNKKKDYIKENPTVSTVYCEIGQKGIKSLTVTIVSIDGERKLTWFAEGTKNAYMLFPGTHIIEATASTTRPGGVYKNVTEDFGPQKLEVEIEESKVYVLGFDIKNKEFTFTEKK